MVGKLLPDLQCQPFKVYGNSQLDRMTTSGQGCYIGEVCCAAPTYADDMVVLTDDKVSLQSLLNIAVETSLMEKYLLQPVNSVNSVLLYIFNSVAKRTTTKMEPGMTLKWGGGYACGE